MGKPITTKSTGICFAFPDVCWTPAPGSPVPVPYPNIGQLLDADPVFDEVKAGGNPVVHIDSEILRTTGDEAGTKGGVANGGKHPGGKVEIISASSSVFVHGKGVVRMFDPTWQNDMNAQGTVLGGVPTVLVGG